MDNPESIPIKKISKNFKFIGLCSLTRFIDFWSNISQNRRLNIFLSGTRGSKILKLLSSDSLRCVSRFAISTKSLRLKMRLGLKSPKMPKRPFFTPEEGAKKTYIILDVSGVGYWKYPPVIQMNYEEVIEKQYPLNCSF